MKEQEQRRITIGQILMADRKGQYSVQTIEPEGCAYLRTFDGGHLSEKEPGNLKYNDFDLYHNESDGTYTYRFWKRDIDVQNGKETSRSYAEPVPGFATEDAAVNHALAVYRGEQPEYISSELQEWRRQAWWLVMPIILRRQAKDDPTQIPQLYSMVTQLRDEVHPAARLQWDSLERTLESALRKDLAVPTAAPAEWAAAAQWGKKLDKAWNALEKAHKELQTTIRKPPEREADLLGKIQAALIDYLEAARQIRDARDKERG